METYTVEIRDGCTILRDSVPITALAKMGSRDDVMDPGLAQRFNASFVFGHPKDIDELRKTAPPHKDPRRCSQPFTSSNLLARNRGAWRIEQRAVRCSYAMFYRCRGWP